MDRGVAPMETPPATKSWYRILYVQVLIAVALGIAVGWIAPDLGKSLKPLGDGFIKLVKMMIAPVIFCTIVTGIAGMQNTKKVGSVGLKAIIYFESIVNKYPDHAFAHYALAIAYGGAGRKNEDVVHHNERFVELINKDVNWAKYANQFGLA